MAVDLDRVVPALHAAAGLDVRVASRGTRWYHEPFADGLVVVYEEGGDRGARVLLAKEVAGLRLAEGELRARAVENLRRQLHTVEQLGGPDVHLIAAGGTYDASLLLVDAFWDPRKVRVRGDFVVAVPGHDVLWVTGSDSPMGIARLRQLARETLAKSEHPLTAELLVRRDGGWTLLPAWQPTRPAAGLGTRVRRILGRLFGR